VTGFAGRCGAGPRRHKPGKLHADKAYDHTDLRNWVRDQGITVRIARKGIETSKKLGKHRWVIERRQNNRHYSLCRRYLRLPSL
jgi:hypothetical protein